MTRKERYKYILDYFKEISPEVTTELEFGSAFQLLVATLLSAQCTDKRINQVTPALFARYPDAPSMAQATPEDIFTYVRSVSYPNSKSKHLVEMAQMLVRDFDGEVPDNTTDLVKLPGVGRKTANVVQAVWYGKASGGYSCISSESSIRIGFSKIQHSLKGGVGIDEIYPRGGRVKRTSLASSSWTLYLPKFAT